MPPSAFTSLVLQIIRAIPFGMVCTYGGVAALAGSPRGARQVVRILHVYGEKEKLPWHRVVNRLGEISLPAGAGFEEQRFLLRGEGIVFDERGRIDLSRFLWQPREE
jgi:methylated-DNA-protein-cysteine methyltransferase-like protein